MNDLDASTITSTSPTASLPKRAGLWRVLSMLAVAGALVVSTVSILQARDASNVPTPEREPVALEQTTVTIGDLATPAGAEIAVLGLPTADSRRSFDVGGTTIDLPEGLAAIVALYDGNGGITGLAIAPPGQDRNSVQITAESTAETLLVLSPGILRPDLAETFANVAVVESDPAFTKLVDAVRSNPSLSDRNAELETAYAEIADRLPPQRSVDQGCDSVIARDAYASAGTCVQPQTTGLTITNEQDRWALIYSGTEDWTDLCATISPATVAGDEVLIPIEQCVGESLMVAPGRITNQRENQEIIEQRVLAAAAINELYAYAGPFANLAGSSAGYTDETVPHIRQNAAELVASLSLLAESSEEFATALEVSRSASTAPDRHVSAITAARFIIEAADSTRLIPQRTPGDAQHLQILDFFARSAERMVGSRTDWRWEADAVGMIDFGEDT